MFELDVPTVVFNWQDITYSILVNMLSTDPGAQASHQGKGKQQGVYALHSYVSLHKFAKLQAGQLRLTSTIKSFVILHYQHQNISQANKTNICMNNGLNYSLYDS